MDYVPRVGNDVKEREETQTYCFGLIFYGRTKHPNFLDLI